MTGSTLEFMTALQAVVTSLPCNGSLPEGVGYDNVAQHLFEAVNIHLQKPGGSGTIANFNYIGWFSGNYPMVAPTAGLPAALQVLADAVGPEA